jgi:feruloyl esterase
MDMISIINHWVETGKAPDRIIVKNPPNQQPMTQAICRYPQTAKYKGSGDTDNATNFECKPE